VLTVLIALTARPAAAGLVGANRCSWGPKYWCANIPQAKSCGAVTHCIKAVWEKEDTPADTDEVCDICKEMVGEARDTLQSNETQEELREVFDGSCNLIPIKVVAKECRTIADEFVPELVETLASEMNPDTVCTVAGLCNSARIDTLLEQYYAQKGDVCGACRSDVQNIAMQLRTLGEKQVESKLLEMCGYLGSYSDACMYTVHTEIKTIIDFLTEEINPNLCEIQGICLGDSTAVSTNSVNDLQCEFCEKVVKHWIDVYASDSSLEEFKEVLDGICDKLDSKNSAHCKHIVDDYYIPIFEYVRQIDPGMVCSLVGLCGNKGFLELDEGVPVSSLFIQPEETRMVPLVAATKESSEKPGCVMCEYVLHELQTFLKNGDTEEEIKEYIDAVCDHMPSVIKGECRKFVDDYGALILDYLVQEIDPSQICTKIKLCDGVQMLSEYEKKGANCETCEFVMNEVFSILSDKDDQEMVMNVLESVCYRLPASIDMPCENFVKKYAPMILDIVSESLTADEVCDALELCEEKEEKPDLVTDSGCVLCEYVISNLDKMITDKGNEEEIKQALEAVCAYLPQSVTKECTSFVDTYTDLIIDMIAKEVSPEEICTNLGLCKKTGEVTVPQPSALINPVADVNKGPYCTLCEYAISTVDQMIQEDATEKEIEDTLDIVCYHLTAPVHKECVTMVEKYTKEIIDMLVKDYTPAMVCSKIALCVNSEISSNHISALDDFYEEVQDINDDDDDEESAGVGCVMCEFAMKVVDEHLEDSPTVDQVERVVQFLCSYLPGSIADQCEAFVDKNGQRLIDALVKDDLDPAEVCTIELNLCDGADLSAPPSTGNCDFPPELWCSTPFHAKLCGATELCQVTAWNVVKTYNNF